MGIRKFGSPDTLIYGTLINSYLQLQFEQRHHRATRCVCLKLGVMD